MNISLFAALVRNLLQTDILCLDEEQNTLSLFEKKYCYNKALQPSFTVEVLSPLMREMQEHIIYGIRDDLGICILAFRFEGNSFLVGPYVVLEYDPVKVYRALISKRLHASLAPSVKMYYSAFPLQSTFTMRSTLIGCMRALTGNSEDYAYCRLQSPVQTAKFPPRSFTEALDYSTLYQRYELENRFLGMIEMGDTANVVNAFLKMSTQGMGKYRYINAIYHDPSIALAMVRALARKAAERGGVSVIEINDITQRAVQKMYTAKNLQEQMQHTCTMIYELTEAVNRKRFQVSNFSPPIKKAVEFLNHNFSSKISLADLATRVGLSETYLSKAFKKEVHMTVTQYIAHLRCQQAAELLRLTELPIQQISDYVGYADNNYFVKIFKVQYGVTPSEYRTNKG